MRPFQYCVESLPDSWTCWRKTRLNRISAPIEQHGGADQLAARAAAAERLPARAGEPEDPGGDQERRGHGRELRAADQHRDDRREHDPEVVERPPFFTSARTISHEQSAYHG